MSERSAQKSLRYWSYVVIVVVFLLRPMLVQADDFQDPAAAPWISEVPCKDKPDNRSVVTLSGHDFIICYSLQEGEKELTPYKSGYHFVTLLITAYGPKDSPLLNIQSLEVADPGRQPGVIAEAPSEPHVDKGPTTKISYRYSIRLGNELRPEPYQMRIVVSLGSKTDRLYFTVPMGAAGGDWLELTKESQKSVECWSGKLCSTLNLVVINKLPYPIELTQVSVTSEPSDLLQATASSTPLKLKSGNSPQQVTISLQAKPLSFFRALSGLRIPKAYLNVNYQDQYGRESLQQISMDLEVRPNLVLLATMLLLGAIAGTIVRIDLSRLQKANVITKKQRLVFAFITFATGVLVCVIALFANLRLVVFADQSTYSAWDPKMLFLTSLIGTIGGIPVLYARLKLPSPSEAKGSTDSSQTGNGNENQTS